MKSSTKLYFGILISSSLLISGCSRREKLPQMPDIGIPEEEMNSHIHLIAPAGWNTFKTDEIITLNVDVISDDTIAFEANYGAVIFALKDDQWVELPNLMKYPEGHFLLEPSRGDPFKQGAAGMAPIIPATNKTVLVRIILIGNIYRDGKITDERTAAYIDVILKP